MKYPSNTFDDEVAPFSTRGTYPLKGHRVASMTADGISIKRLKKPHFQGKDAPSQQGFYGKNVHVKAPRGPIAPWVVMPDVQANDADQRSKRLLQCKR